MARVLVVNDDRDLASALHELLTDVGYEAAIAADGREGLQMLAHWPADLILLDLLMPHLDGWGFLRELATRDWHPPPIVVVWSIAGPDDLERARRLGATECLPRPSTGPDTLLETIERLINR